MAAVKLDRLFLRDRAAATRLLGRVPAIEAGCWTHRPMSDAVRIRLARDPADFEACVRPQRDVWDLSDLEITSAVQVVATVHAGGR